jgi:hypothetical protein
MAHHPRGERDEMDAVDQALALASNQAKDGIVDEIARR